MFTITKIENNFYLTQEEELLFRNKKTMIKKLQCFLDELYTRLGEDIKFKPEIISSGCAYTISAKDDIIINSQSRSRNYKIYKISIIGTIHKTEKDAGIYLERLINTLIMELNDSDSIPEDELNSDDIFDIIN